jgi:peptidoglycan/xylan/chitin deacetylase (PgdA/CDA1 family)
MNGTENKMVKTRSLPRDDHSYRFILQILGARVPIEKIPQSLLEKTFYEIARVEETENPARDMWGNWDWQYTDAQRKGQIYIPTIDRDILKLKEITGEIHYAPPWPNGKRFALCLTHDVDFVSRIALSPKAARQTLRGMVKSKSTPFKKAVNLVRLGGQLSLQHFLLSGKDDPYWQYEKWLELEDRFGFHSTFYFFPSPLSRAHEWDCSYQLSDTVKYHTKKVTVSEMIREIKKSGWEIGLHGSYYSALDQDLLTSQKKTIEEAAEESIISTRQHFLHYDVRITPKLQANAGFKTDSTQGFNRSIGFRSATSFPYYCWDFDQENTGPMLEIPQHIMDGGLFTENALEYNSDLAIKHSIQLMDEVESVGGCLTLSWHPHNITNGMWWNVYKTLLEEASRRNAWGCSAGELHTWWKEREEVILK